MQTIVLPKIPRPYDYFVASLAYIAASEKDREGLIEIETEEMPANTQNREIRNYLCDYFPAEASSVINMHFKYNVCDPIICSDKPIIEKVKEIANAIMSRFDYKTLVEVL